VARERMETEPFLPKTPLLRTCREGPGKSRPAVQVVQERQFRSPTRSSIPPRECGEPGHSGTSWKTPRRQGKAGDLANLRSQSSSRRHGIPHWPTCGTRKPASFSPGVHENFYRDRSAKPRKRRTAMTLKVLTLWGPGRRSSSSPG
jgi:hypothetical protein